MPGSTLESTPLLSSNTTSTSRGAGQQHARTNSSSNASYYFLNRQGSTTVGDAEFGARHVEEEIMPAGANEEEFTPRPLGPRKPSMNRQVTNGGGVTSSGRSGGPSGGGGGSLFGTVARWFGRSPDPTQGGGPYGGVGTLLKVRKAPVKIEPKVFFANERTFLAWMHLSVILAGASIAILAFAEDQNPYSQLYGVIMLPVAIAFIVYSMYQYARRASMIRHRHPGPYEDTTGPAVLGVMLMLSILAQFALKLYAMREGL